MFTGFDAPGIEVIIAKHNELRQRVASGSEANGDQPAASDMMKVTWNEELAAIAQHWPISVYLGTMMIGPNVTNVMGHTLDKMLILAGILRNLLGTR